jgi:hypothetical protein
MVALLILTSAVAALLVIPIYVLYTLTKGTIVTQHDVSIAIVVLLVSTVIFSMVVALFTKAKRQEIVGVSAASVRPTQLPDLC